MISFTTIYESQVTYRQIAMFVIGLTGGIGSGKSTVAKLFGEKGIYIIDTDQIAKTLVTPDKPAYQKIIEHFGTTVCSEMGLNRKYLASLVFADPHQRKWLEHLLHPLIWQEVQAQLLKATSLYCIIVIPLLFETQVRPAINRILLVDTTEEQQISRVQARDTLSTDEIKQILTIQVSRETRLRGADDIIHNEGTFSDLVPQVEKLHQYYLKLATDKN